MSPRGEGLPGRDDPRRDVDDEVEDYLRRRARELEEGGMDPAAARRAAEEAFGDVEGVRRACVRIQRRRRVRTTLGTALRAAVQELRFGARALRKRPGFTSVAVLTLGLGVGANAALFSVMNAVVLRPLPFAEPDRLVQVWESDPRRPTRDPSPADYLDLRRDAESFEALTAYHETSGNLTGEGEPESVGYASVSANFFRTLGVDPALGSAFGPDPVDAGVDRAVLSDGLWRRRYGADPTVVGRSLRVDGVAYEILGVMPPTFRFPADADFWVAAPRDVPGSRFLSTSPAEPLRDAWYHEVVGRLAPGVDLAGASAEMDALAARLAADYPLPNEGLRIRLVPLKEETLGDTGRTLWLLLGATGLVLLVACTNVANLLLARGVARHAEVGVRIALGAGRMRIVGHVLAESFVLAAAGAVVGAAAGAGGLRLLRPTLAAALPRGSEIGVDGAVLVFAALAALVTVLLFGGFPARAAARAGGAARVARGATTSGKGRRLGDALVAIEVAMAVVLVLGAGLLLRSVAKIASVDLGFDAEALTVAWVGLPGAGDLSMDERVGFYGSVGDRLAALPGVRGVAWTQASPLGAGAGAGLRIEGVPETANRTRVDVRWQVVSPGYFDVAGIRLLAGRMFGPEDGSGAEPVAIVSASLARAAFGGEDPLGRRINTGLDGRVGDDWRWVRVVGVVADTRNRGPTRGPDPVLFRPLAQGGPGFPGSRLLAVLRTDGATPALPPLVRKVVGDVDADAPVYGLASATALTGAYTGERRLVLLLLGIFAALALGLGAVGTYGVTAFAVSRRTREVGVRLALGADRGGITVLVLRQGLAPVALGLLAGAAAGAAGSRLLTSLLFEVHPLDPVTFLVVPVLLVAVSTLAVWVPARRAARMDPVRALSSE